MENFEITQSWSAGCRFNSFIPLTPFKDILSFTGDFCRTVPPYVVVQDYRYAVQRINCRGFGHPLG